MDRQKLIEDNMKLVYFLINKHYPNCSNDEDIIQCGMLGLCRAAETWDESKSLFSTYAGKCILHEIYAEFRKRRKLNGQLSLDYPVYGVNDEVDSFGDMLVGDSDVDYINIEPFYNTLKPREQEVFGLLYTGLTGAEIGRKLGISRQLANVYIRRLRTLWRNYYGE